MYLKRRWFSEWNTVPTVRLYREHLSLHPTNRRYTVPPSNVHVCESVSVSCFRTSCVLILLLWFTWGDSEAWRWRVWGGPACSQWLSWGTGFHRSAPRFLQTAWAGSPPPSSGSDPSPPDSAHTSPCRPSLRGGPIRAKVDWKDVYLCLITNISLLYIYSPNTCI